MSNAMDHDREIADLVGRYNARIDRLRPCLTQGVPDLRKRCSQEMNSLILNREAIRRGLVEVPDAGEFCTTCLPDECRA